MDNEVLVHIRAPARIVDDRRYLAIAQGILGFEPATMTRVTSDHPKLDNTDAMQDSTGSLSTGGSFPGQDSPQTSSTSGLCKEKPTGSQPLLKGGSNVRNVYGVTKATPANRRWLPKKVINPPFKSPVRRKEIRSVSVDNACITPSCDKLVAPAEGRSSVLVPNTEQQKRKRAWSETFSSQLDSAIIDNSQPTRSVKLSHPTIRHQHTSCATSSSTSRIHNLSHIQGENTDNAEILKPSIHNELVTKSTTNQLAKTIKSVLNLGTATDISTQPPMETGAPNASISKSGLVAGKESASAEDDYSTVTPSDQAWSRQKQDIGIDGSSQIAVKMSPIDLVTPDASNVACPETATVEADPSVNDLSSVVTNGSKLCKSPTPHSVLLSVQALPLVISSPNPTIDQLTGPTYNFPVLRATADGLSMPSRFRPESMTRCVAERERGYWKIPFAIVTPEIARARREGTRNWPHTTKEPTSRPLLKHAELTEDEVLTIWEDLTQFVASGNAGWSVRVIRRNCSVVRGTDELSYDRTLFYLQIYCYGEAIPYTYAMLLLCTRMYVLCRPVHWISALDEQVVVTMTGHEVRKGDLSEWSGHIDNRGRKLWGCR